MSNFFEMTYSDPRKTGKRKSRHKCICCDKIVQDGEVVLMGRLSRKTRVMHRNCSLRMRPDGANYTWGVWFEWLVKAKDVRGTQGSWFKETIEEFIKRTG